MKKFMGIFIMMNYKYKFSIFKFDSHFESGNLNYVQKIKEK